MEWTKDEDQGNTLAYDTTASMFFIAALLICILVPWTFSFLSKFIRPNAVKEAMRGTIRAEAYCQRSQCQCELCKHKNSSMVKEARMWRNILTVPNLIRIAILSSLWVIFFRLIAQIALVESLDVGAFNPFEILGIAEDATIKEIKKAYRGMSLLYHPDRNRDDVTAANMFIRISKAYTALTDETARKNFEKFGNPDGPGNMKVGLGLPKWVVMEDNQMFVLCVFFIVVLGLVPLTFIYAHNRMKRFSASGVRVETLQFLSFYMHDGTRAKLAPEFLAASAEAREIEVRESDAHSMQKIEKALRDSPFATQTAFTMPSVTKNYYLIHCHMLRKTDLLDQNLKDDLKKILQASPLVTQSMLELAFVNHWHQTVQSVLEFRRSLLQAQIPGQRASLMQIPHMTTEIVDALTSRKENPIRTLKELVETDYEKALPETLKQSKFTDGQVVDMMAFLKHVPNIKITAHIDVDGEDDCVVGDIATCHITMKRENLLKIAKESNGKISESSIACGAVHCPYFPDTKFEEWFIFLQEEESGKIVEYKRVQSTKAEVDVPIQFRIEEEGEKKLLVFAMCDSYSGLDNFVPVSFTAINESEVEREIFIHPEDAALDEEPNLVQTFLGEMVPASDEESESEEIDLDARR